MSYDSSVDNAPAAFKAAVSDAIAFFESWFTNPITIHIDVGYGEVGGQALGAGDLGERLTFLDNFSYAQIRNALGAGAMSSDQTTAAGTLPSADPAGGNYWVATAEAKALGLLGASSNVDGYVGCSSTASFAYDPNNRAVPGKSTSSASSSTRFQRCWAGFCSLPGRSAICRTTTGHWISSIIRRRVSAISSARRPGISRSTAATRTSTNFNTKQNGDFGDWVVTARNDAFLAFSNPGVDNAVSPPDLREMNVLGYDFATATVSSGETHSATGIESDIVLSGGTVVVAPAGTSIDAIVESGGYDVISSGGTADATALGGTEFVLAGGWPTAPRSRAVSRLSNPAGSRAVRLSTAAIKSSSPGRSPATRP